MCSSNTGPCLLGVLRPGLFALPPKPITFSFRDRNRPRGARDTQRCSSPPATLSFHSFIVSFFPLFSTDVVIKSTILSIKRKQGAADALRQRSRGGRVHFQKVLSDQRVCRPAYNYKATRVVIIQLCTTLALYFGFAAEQDGVKVTGSFREAAEGHDGRSGPIP